MRTSELIIESSELYKNGDYSGAILKLNHALLLDPENIEVKGLLLQIYIETEDKVNVLFITEQLLAVDPMNVIHLFHRANCFNDMNNIDTAMDLFNQIISIDPKFYLAYAGRGIVYQKRKQYELAIDDLTLAIKMTKKSEILYAERGLVFIEMQDFENALKDFSYALKIDKNYDVARLYKSVALRMLGKDKKAQIDIEKIRNEDYFESEGFHQRGIIYQKNNRHTEALADFNKAIEMDAYNVEARYSRAMCFARFYKFEKALEDLDYAMQCQCDHFKDYLLNGYADVFRKMKKFDQAIDYANQSLQLNPDFYWAHVTLAETYGELGEDDKFHENLGVALKAGYDLKEIDQPIKDKYFYTKEFKQFHSR